ncbi:C2-domain ABA-related 7-like protein [Tanacetum coccineum]
MQKTKTKVIKGNCNPVWNDELTLTMKDPKDPIHIAVYDKDKFSNDDSMGMAEIDVKPYIECLRMGLNYNNLPNGTKLERVHPKKNNYLADQSCIVWENGKIVQDMVLRLRDVECGEKTKTKVIKGNCNPVWNDELTLTMKDPKDPIHIAVYDKDKLVTTNSMGMQRIDV